MLSNMKNIKNRALVLVLTFFILILCEKHIEKRIGAIKHHKIYGDIVEKGMELLGKKEGLWITYYGQNKQRQGNIYFHGALYGGTIALQSNGMIKEKNIDVVWMNNYHQIQQPNDTLKLAIVFDTLKPGFVKLKGLMLNQKKHGIWYSYHEDGSIFIESCYLNNSLNGPSITYHSNGKILDKSNYFQNKEDGYFEQFHDSGILYRCGWYKNGKMIGVWKYYTDEGKLNKKIKYFDDGRTKILLDRKLIPPTPNLK